MYTEYTGKNFFNKLPLFIKVGLAVTAVLLLTYSIEIVLYIFLIPKDGDPEMTVTLNTLAQGLSYYLVANLIVSLILIAIFEYARKNTTFRWWYVIILLLICYPASLASKILYTLLRTGFKMGEFIDFSFLSGLSNYPSLLSAILAYGITIYWNVARVERENKLKAEAMLKDARWKMLRYQVNPHFLFNSLNSIMALINKDKDLARKVVNELSAYFRYTLSWNDRSVISFSEELKAVTHYLEIQKIRFRERLDYNFEIELKPDELVVPIFSLQILVENAVKYGLKTCPGVVKVEIKAMEENECFIISVANSGRLWNGNNEDTQDYNTDGTSSGLINLRERLDLMYKGHAGFSLFETQQRVIAEIRIKKSAYNI